MCPYPAERETSELQAIEAIKAWLKEHNIHSSLCSTEDNLIATVEFYSTTGYPIASGLGKGNGAVAGAYFEAFEHMMLEYDFTSSHIKVGLLKEWLRSDKCHSQCLYGKILTEYENVLLKFSSYYSLLSLKEYLIPKALIDPFYVETIQPNEAYSFLNKYTSKSGWAAGSSFEETVLHGANEVVEHHCLGEFYKQYLDFSEYSGEFYRITPPKRLLEKYQQSLPNIDEISFVMSMTPIDSYFCVCVMPSLTTPMAFRSSGVSYSEFHAIEIALSELVQNIENYDDVELESDLKVAKFLSSDDTLCPITDLSKLGRVPLLDLSDLKQDPMSFNEHYGHLISSLSEKEYDLLVHSAFKQGTIWLTSTYIPGLERFNLIDKGKSVVLLDD